MKKYRYEIEYRLDNEDYDDDYIDGLNSMKEAKEEAIKLIQSYKKRLVKLDIKKFDLASDYLEEHITII